MTTNELIAKLQAEVDKRPGSGDNEILICRNNGKKTYRRHEITSWGWRLWYAQDGNDDGRVVLGLDFEGTAY